jgi:hypothetical protein
VLYVPLWDLMSLLDGFYLQYVNATDVDLPLPDDSNLGKSAYKFLADMSAQYSKVVPSFKPVTARAVEQCVDFWRGNMNWVYRKAKYFAQ